MSKSIPIALMFFALSGCQAFQEKRLPTIQEVQGAAVAACKFLPAAETVTNIISLALPALSTVSSIANAICAAVTAPGAAPGTTPMVVNVPVRGAFVTK